MSRAGLAWHITAAHETSDVAMSSLRLDDIKNSASLRGGGLALPLPLKEMAYSRPLESDSRAEL